MLASLVPKAFDLPGWVYEEKYDGYRILAYKEGSTVTLLSRNQLDRTSTFAVVAAELDEAAHPRAPFAPRVEPGHAALSVSEQPQGHCLSARVAGRNDPVRRQPFALGPGRRRTLQQAGNNEIIKACSSDGDLPPARNNFAFDDTW